MDPMSRDIDKAEYVAEDAAPGLEAFRAGGARSFHLFSPEEVRARYIVSAEAAALTETVEPCTTDHTVSYDDGGEAVSFGVRLYDPRTTEDKGAGAPTAVIVLIHGGGWVMGGLRTHHSLARRLSVRTGQPVLAVDYRLAPEHRYPAAVDDCRQALRWLVGRSDVHGVTVSGVSVVGDSAGGQLAAVVSNELAAGTLDVGVDQYAQVLVYPVTDLREEHMDTAASYRRLRSGFPLVADTMRWFADHYVDRGAVRAVADVSPLLHEPPAGLPPTFVITVGNDPLADEGIDYAAALSKAGIRVRHEHLAGYAHGLFTSAGVVPTGERYVNAVADFIGEWTAAAAGRTAGAEDR
jgi:acetyl esterase